MFVQEVAGEGHVACMPSDAGSLQCFRNLDDEQIARLKAFKLPLLGPGLELEPEVAKLYQKELLLVEDVAKIDFWGERKEAIYVELDRDRLSQLGLKPAVIEQALEAGINCFDTAKVAGCKRVPDPPARITPLRC